VLTVSINTNSDYVRVVSQSWS